MANTEYPDLPNVYPDLPKWQYLDLPKWQNEIRKERIIRNVLFENRGRCPVTHKECLFDTLRGKPLNPG